MRTMLPAFGLLLAGAAAAGTIVPPAYHHDASVASSLSLGGELHRQTADAVDTRATTGIGLCASWQIAPKWSLIGSGGPLVGHRAEKKPEVAPSMSLRNSTTDRNRARRPMVR